MSLQAEKYIENFFQCQIQGIKLYPICNFWQKEDSSKILSYVSLLI